MKVLILGGGGREHALAWKCAQSAQVRTVFVAPGNAGTAAEPKVQNIAIAADDIDALVKFAISELIDLTIVGPEVPLVAGVVDRFRENGLPCFGPTRSAAQLEGSKAFCKAFMERHGIPTAHYQSFTELAPALDYLKHQSLPIVIKADGLAAGKGVVIANTAREATAAVEDMLSGNVFGEAGHRVVIEEFLQGEEASFIVMADGQHALPLASSQDHKARDDGDTGPNTGGMGAYSPAPVVTPEIHDRVMAEVIEPTIRGMSTENMPYTGFLYAGLMIGKDGSPKVLEFNCRFGDPEAQPVLMRLNTDLVELCQLALAGRLDEAHAEWNPDTALGVVMAAGGYPNQYRRGDIITGLDSQWPENTKVFHAGTSHGTNNNQIVTNGGRVLCVCALGSDTADAQARAYDAVGRIDWPGVYFRTDIGHRAIGRS
ncbi:MAG: phosphoribosylamine--glycine ligase [Pseudomonadota bacterium]|nr:phosphoribosylamine--glycine ligase [Pseudomonadota bacterium]